MNCEAFLALLESGQEVGTRPPDGFAAHRAACPSCRRTCEAHEALRAALAAAAPDAKSVRIFEESLFKRLAAEPGFRPTPTGFWRPWMAVSLLLVTLLIAGSVMFRAGPPATPPGLDQPGPASAPAREQPLATPVPEREPEPKPVAVIAGRGRVQHPGKPWADLSLASRASLPPGSHIDLTSGRFTFTSTRVVEVVGPLTGTVDSARITIQTASATMDFSGPRQAFTVGLPHGEFVVTGTKVAVQATPAHQEIRVVSGSVDWQHRASGQRGTLTTGAGLLFEPGQVTPRSEVPAVVPAAPGSASTLPETPTVPAGGPSEPILPGSFPIGSQQGDVSTSVAPIAGSPNAGFLRDGD